MVPVILVRIRPEVALVVPVHADQEEALVALNRRAIFVLLSSTHSPNQNRVLRTIGRVHVPIYDQHALGAQLVDGCL